MTVDEVAIHRAVRNILDARHYPARARFLIAAMEDVQASFGYVPVPAVAELARYFSVQEEDMAAWLQEAPGVFRAQPLGRHVLRICQGPICRARGGSELLREVMLEAGKEAGLTLMPSHCLGMCDHAPAAKLDEERLFGHGGASVSELVLAAVRDINDEGGGT